MIRRLFFMPTLLLSLFISGVVHAQPVVVQRALDDINTRTGRSLTLNDLNWRYSQNVYNGNNLGCPHVPNTSGGPASIVAYQIEFDEGFDEVWEWDYRVSEDGTLFFLCAPEGYNPLATTTPTPAPVLPTILPTIAPTLIYTPLPTAMQFTCIDLLPRLTRGGQARVTPGLPNVLRERPTADSRYIGEVPGEAVFDVLDGPQCAEGYIWWYIRYNGQQGWTIENFETEYVLEPINPSPAVITPYNAVRLQQVIQLDVNALAIFGQTYRHFWTVEDGVPAHYELMSEQPLTWRRLPLSLINVFAALGSSDMAEPLWFVRQTSTEVAVYERQDGEASLLTTLDISDFVVGFTPLDMVAGTGEHLLLAKDDSGRLSLWDLRPETPLSERLILSPFGAFGDAVFTGGDFGLFAAINGSKVNFYDSSGSQLKSISSVTTFHALDFGVNGTIGKLAVGGVYDSTPDIEIWNAGPGALRQTLSIPFGDTPPRPMMHPHLTVIATIGHTPWNHNLYLWDVETGTLVYEQMLPAGGQLTFSADGKMLFAALENGQIFGWATNY